MELFDILDILEIKKQYQIETYSLVDFTVGFDNLIYLLFSQQVPDRINGMFINTIANTRYAAVTVLFDWKSTSVCSATFTDFGRLEFNYHFIRPIGNYIMLLGARCVYHNESNIEQNVLLLDKNGVPVKKLCFGDGIEDCMTTEDGKIIVSYFDEGVFGNYGWKKPIGASGLLAWNAEGDIIWTYNSNDIMDCYAINVDSQNRLWFYYYTAFNLVCTNYQSYMVMSPDIRYSTAFALSATQKHILFSGGYRDLSFYQYDIDSQRGIMGEKRKISIEYQNYEVEESVFHFCGSKLLFLIDDKLCGYDYL